VQAELRIETVRNSIKRRFPRLVLAVRGTRRFVTWIVDVLDIGLNQLTFGRGVSKSIRPGIRLRTHPKPWRESFSYFAAGGSVEEELDAFIRQCNAGMQLIDVGAQYGIFSLVAMAWPRSRALLVEPYPKNVQMLSELRRMNSLSDKRFIVVPVAAGSQDGRVAMEGIDFYLPSPASATFVPMRSLDSLCSEFGFRPTHIKIDVEGFEFEVLKGAVKVLDQCMPVVHLEIHDAFLVRDGTAPSEIHNFMRIHGYDQVWSLVENEPDGAPSVTRTVWCAKH